ncbi:hypothetical protein [Inediibacterium massiliense]|uniref:hypothetical protein n=1 Tax=Inediibacterium massiliense TaxID=1658111 RepID=UPI0006B64612|nr:hypothetical protein [Inediibacterium massiliense]
MDSKVILLLEKMNDTLEKIYDTLKAMDGDKIQNQYMTKKSKDPIEKPIQKEDTDDILKNWESKMPFNEVMDKLYPYHQHKEK